MQKQDVEPQVLVFRHVHPHAVAAQLEVHTLVFDVPDAIKTETRVALAEKDGPDGDAVDLRLSVVQREVDLAHVVNQASNGEHVQCA